MGGGIEGGGGVGEIGGKAEHRTSNIQHPTSNDQKLHLNRSGGDWQELLEETNAENLKTETMNCNHALGVAQVEYDTEIIHVDWDIEQYSGALSEFAFCPYCGHNVRGEARQMLRKILEKHHAETLKKYGVEMPEVISPMAEKEKQKAES